MADEIQTYTPTDEERARQRKRSIAIALTLAAMVVLFFVTTIVRLTSNIQTPVGG